MPLPFARWTGNHPLKKPSTPTVKLTPEGNAKLLAMLPSGYEFTVLAKIKALEPSCSADEVAKALNWEESKVEHVMESLYSKGWIERAN